MSLGNGAGLFMMVAAVLSFAGCQVTVPTSIPEDFRISCGMERDEGGTMSGFSIEHDGSFVRWEGQYVRQDIQAAGQVADAKVDSLWDAAAHLPSREWRLQQFGDVTGFVELHTQGQTRSATFRLRGEDHVELRRLHAMCLRIADTAESRPEGEL